MSPSGNSRLGVVHCTRSLSAKSRPQPRIFLISFFSQGRLNPQVETRRVAIRRFRGHFLSFVNGAKYTVPMGIGEPEVPIPR